MTTPTDPKVIAAIEAEFSETVKEAAKLAIDRMLGKVPPPALNRGRIVDDNSIRAWWRGRVEPMSAPTEQEIREAVQKRLDVLIAEDGTNTPDWIADVLTPLRYNPPLAGYNPSLWADLRPSQEARLGGT